MKLGLAKHNDFYIVGDEVMMAVVVAQGGEVVQEPREWPDERPCNPREDCGVGFRQIHRGHKVSEFKQVDSVNAQADNHDELRAYVAHYGTSIWIEQECGEISIYSREQAIALRDWLTRAIGE